MSEAISRVVERESFDIVQIETSTLCCFTYPEHSRLVLDEHDVEYEARYRRYRRYQECRSGGSTIGWNTASSSARSVVAGCGCTAASLPPLVRSKLHEVMWDPPRQQSCRTASTWKTFTPSRNRCGRTDRLTGLMAYRPNADAARWFARDVLPRVWRARPAATFTIVGRDVPPDVERLRAANVRITGEVPDTRPYWQTPPCS